MTGAEREWCRRSRITAWGPRRLCARHPSRGGIIGALAPQRRTWPRHVGLRRIGPGVWDDPLHGGSAGDHAAVAQTDLNAAALSQLERTSGPLEFQRAAGWPEVVVLTIAALSVLGG